MDKLFQVNHINVEEVTEFSLKNPWKPQYSMSQVRWFLTELISHHNLVFDLHDQSGRVSVAVLLDKINNPANDACLEILGLRSDVKLQALYSKFLKLAKERTPKNRSGFQVCLPEETPLSSDFLIDQGLIHYYDTFKIQHLRPGIVPRSDHREIVNASVNDANEVYEVLCMSFAQNPDTCIPEKNIWTSAFLKSPKSHCYLWREDNKILGFASFVEDEAGVGAEIRTIGVLPDHRGRGIGKDLLNYCLNRTSDFGIGRCYLSVAVTNKRALDLYTRAGFEATEKYFCYRMIF